MESHGPESHEGVVIGQPTILPVPSVLTRGQRRIQQSPELQVRHQFLLEIFRSLNLIFFLLSTYLVCLFD